MDRTHNPHRVTRADEPDASMDDLRMPRRQDFPDETRAPPLDLEAVRAYVEGTMPPAVRDSVSRLEARFRCWNQAIALYRVELARELVEEVGRARCDGLKPPAAP
jgi:hypothetical protein